MSTTAYDTLLPDVLIDTPGCSGFLALTHIRAAASEFFLDSLVWRQTLDPIDVSAGVDVYDVDPLSNTYNERILGISYMGRPLTPKSTDVLDALRLEAGQGECNSWIEYYGQINPTQIILYGMPQNNEPGALVADVVTVPTRSALGIDSAMMDRYWEPIVRGAKSRILLIPDKPWSNPGLAATYRDDSNRLAANAKASAAQGFGRTPIRVKYQR